MQGTRKARSVLAIWVGVGMIFGAGVAASGLEGSDLLRFAAQAPAVWIAAAALLVLVATGVGTAWMNQIDELAQRAHYVAWYWGGSMALAVLLFIFFAGPALSHVIDFDAILTPLEDVYGRGAGFFAGVSVCLVALTLGYSGWWMLYWMRKQ